MSFNIFVLSEEISTSENTERDTIIIMMIKKLILNVKDLKTFLSIKLYLLSNILSTAIAAASSACLAVSFPVHADKISFINADLIFAACGTFGSATAFLIWST